LIGGINTFGYVLNTPLNATDALGLHTEVIAWNPVGMGSSSFGHFSVNLNGQNYSWGPRGWDGNQDASSYANNQMEFRGGRGAVLNLSEGQEKQLQQCLETRGGKYSFLNNNCTTPAEACLKELAVDSRGAATPDQMLGVIRNIPGLLNSNTLYPQR